MPEANQQKTAADAPAPRKRRDRRRFRPTDYGLIKRVLEYALSYRAMIVRGLIIGIIATFLGAANILALLPALQTMLEPQENRAAQIVKLTKDLDERRVKFGELKAAGRQMEALRAYGDIKKREAQLKLAEFMVQEREEAVFWVVGIVILMQIIKAFLEFYSKFQLSKAFLFASNKIRTRLYEHAIHLDMAHFQANTTGDLMGRLNNDIRQVRTVFGRMISDIVMVPFSVLSLLLVLIILNARLTMIVGVAIPLVIIPMGLLGKKLRQMGKADEAEDVKILDVIAETFQALSIVKAFTSEKFEIGRFETKARDITRRQNRREMIRLLAEPIVETIGVLSIGAAVALGSYLILKSSRAEMSPAEFIAYIIVLSRFYPPIKSLSQNYVKLQKSLASAERIFEVMDIQPTIIDQPGQADAAPIVSGIEFRDVTFTYPGAPDASLRNVSVTIPRGKRIALVGRTGSGKTTLARLVPRFFDPEKGQILYDGTPITELRVSTLRRQIGYVTQDTHLYNESVRYNVAYAMPEVTQEDVERAARAANAHDFIMKLEHGYDTVIGERGGKLSGGQRQRLAIARALLRNSPILILDEATSALDNESEALVNEAIDRLMEGRTSIVIAHRLSTVRNADEILVMEAGRIIERGTHEQLVAAGGRYAELAALANLGEESEQIDVAAPVPPTSPPPRSSEDDDENDEDDDADATGDEELGRDRRPAT